MARLTDELDDFEERTGIRFGETSADLLTENARRSASMVESMTSSTFRKEK